MSGEVVKWGEYQGRITVTAAELAEHERQQKHARDWVKARRYIRELTAMADEIEASPEYKLEARIRWSGVFALPDEAAWDEAVRRTRACESPWVDLNDDDAYEDWLKRRAAKGE